jgi:glycosyltransferase involved in cell wall biosynthesis
MPSALKATVAICTYNGADRIAAVLAALARQTLNPHDWEVLVIDNASTDGVGAVANDHILGAFHGRGRVVREAQPGLSHARACAAQQAQGEIICFLDDDNIPESEFVENAVQAFLQHPLAGALGGKVLPAWEAPPSALALAVQDFALAICDRGEQVFRYDRGLGPVGAGLCIRTELLQQIYRTDNIARSVAGRTGNGYGGGEDLAIAILAWQLGLECWYVPSLIIRHQLPVRRMEKDYLMRLYEGIGRGQAAVRPLYDWKARTPLAWLVGLKDFCRWRLGQWRGPAPALRQAYPSIAGDLHELQQRLVWGRAVHALGPFW